MANNFNILILSILLVSVCNGVLSMDAHRRLINRKNLGESKEQDPKPSNEEVDDDMSSERPANSSTESLINSARDESTTISQFLTQNPQCKCTCEEKPSLTEATTTSATEMQPTTTVTFMCPSAATSPPCQPDGGRANSSEKFEEGFFSKEVVKRSDSEESKSDKLSSESKEKHGMESFDILIKSHGNRKQKKKDKKDKKDRHGNYRHGHYKNREGKKGKRNYSSSSEEYENQHKRRNETDKGKKEKKHHRHRRGLSGVWDLFS